MIKYFTVVIILIFIRSAALLSQEELSEKIDFKGYVSDLPSAINLGNKWIFDNLVHNRLNFYYYPNNTFSASIQIRNRFMAGKSVRITPGYNKSLDNEAGFLDLSMNIIDEKDYVLNTTIDRLWVKYVSGNFEATLGRQRINWGQTYVWNPNDIFNAYSFFDFDYVERPGSDALRMQYYLGYTSVAEAAIKLDSAKNVTLAGLYKFNKWQYDIQLLAGVLAGSDYALGVGWSGNIWDFGCKGEASYFHPKRNFGDTAGIFMLTGGLDYIFENELYVQLEALFADRPGGFSPAELLNYFTSDLTVKNLAFTDFSLFANLSYPPNPLVSIGLSGMYYPGLDGFYVGPTFSYSILKNLDFSIFYQYFSIVMPDIITMQDTRQDFNLAFLRLKWSF